MTPSALASSTNAGLLSRRARALPRGIATAHPIFAARAENGELWDVEGRGYIDFAGGIATLNTGHRHPAVLAAVQQQLGLFTHTAFQVTGYEVYIALAERLNRLAPFRGESKTILFTTGAEATENAVKIARVATKRSAVIAFAGGFHGRTLLALALTGKNRPYKRSFERLPGEVFHLPFPALERGVSSDDTLRALDLLFRASVEPSEVAAVIIEPILGEGGFHEAAPEFLRQLRAICDQHRIVLIADEVQTGFARTGRIFAIEHSGVEPELVTVAKSMAGGFPLSGVIGRADIMDAAEPGGLGGTYAGNPVSCAAALAVLDVIQRENLCDRANAIGERLKTALRRIASRNDVPGISSIRGRGAMVAFDLVRAPGSSEPAADLAKAVLELALADGLILLSCGYDANTIRLLMPLTMEDALLDEGVVRLERALVAAAGL